MITQALCNIVTANENLISQLWDTYLRLPEEQLILMYVNVFAAQMMALTYTRD